MKFTDEEKILDKTGLDYQVLDSSCCGMAGAFGYEKGDHFEVSLACGERVLLPSVRSAPKETLIIADGFSCREQISQATNRQGKSTLSAPIQSGTVPPVMSAPGSSSRFCWGRVCCLPVERWYGTCGAGEHEAGMLEVKLFDAGIHR